MRLLDRIYTKNISSDRLGRQILGALFQWRAKPFWAFLLLVTPFSVGISFLLTKEPLYPCLQLLGLNLVVWLTVKVCRTLTGAFSLSRNENGITACQIIILAMLGVWIIGFGIIFDIRNNGQIAAAIGVVGGVLGWIFQDRVKGVAAFISLRRHHLLNIGDWIRVPKLDADGEVRKVTLTTVTLYNWDTTTSSIPISALQSEHFINLQHMADGKTYGRRMIREFTLDTGWIHPLDAEEARRLRSGWMDISRCLPEEEVKEGALNAHLLRLYLYHWLMGNPYVSQKPNPLVRWTDVTDSGMTLQILAFLTESGLYAFEWQQSLIVEHIVTALKWFGMRLYQTPSAYDVGNSNIHLVDVPATYRKEEQP